MKTKLGISVSLMGALLYFGGLFGGYVVLALMVGYVLLKEEDLWLKRAALKSVLVCVSYSILYYVISLVPNLYSIFSSFLSIFDATMPGYFFVSLSNVLQTLLYIARTVILLLLGIMSLLHKNDAKDPLDPLVEKFL